MALNTYMAKGYLVKAPVVTSYMKKNEQHLMARFTLAVNGNTKDAVDYIPMTCFQEKTVEFMQKHCTVGTQLLVQATLHNSSYTKSSGKGKDKSEQTVYSLECIANQIDLLSQPRAYYEAKGAEESEMELQED